MYKVVAKKSLNATVTMMEIEAPLVAKKAQPGQFIILRVNENGERIPLTIAGYDRKRGTVRIIFQVVGATTFKLNQKNVGESIADFVGPLGTPTHTEGLNRRRRLCHRAAGSSKAAQDGLPCPRDHRLSQQGSFDPGGGISRLL